MDGALMSAATIAREVRDGERTAVDVARETLARSAAYDKVQPQAWILRLPQAHILAAAERVDARIAAGERLPLAGVPFAVKDNIDVAGLATTAGCPAFAYRPDETAPVVQRLLDSGAVLVGKTNLDQFATGLSGTRSPYGACAAVHNRAYVSGGSSSGSAVVVAAGLVAFALGTDTAGSGRAPAALNGLVGLKPSRGRWSARGVVPACRSLDCVTVLAGDVEDAALVDGVASGFDPADIYSRHAPQGAAASIGANFRFGVPRPDQLAWLGDGQSARLFQVAAARVEAMGGEAIELDIGPLLATARLLYDGPWVAERTAAMETLLRSNPGAVHPVVRTILQGGLSVSAVEAFKAQYQLLTHRRAAEAIWESVDVLLLPTCPTTYRMDEMLAEPVALNANLGLYTNFVNLLDLSAIALPAGFRDNATGFGVSLIAPAFADTALLDLGRRYERAGTLAPAPPLDLAAEPLEVMLAVVGAHLHGMPLHWQLSSRGARLVRSCRTAPSYRLYAMAESSPPKPALAHVGASARGAAIEVEVYALGVEAFGSFVAEVPQPLAIGTVALEDGVEVKGFVAEPRALDGARDITGFGGWRAYIASI
jgi:allophanate hydrolase